MDENEVKMPLLNVDEHAGRVGHTLPRESMRIKFYHTLVVAVALLSLAGNMVMTRQYYQLSASQDQCRSKYSEVYQFGGILRLTIRSWPWLERTHSVRNLISI